MVQLAAEVSDYGDTILFLIIGLASGWAASLLMKRSDMGLAGFMVVGIIGAVLGNVAFQKLDINLGATLGNAMLGDLVGAVAGSVALLVVAGFLKPKKKD